MAAGTPVVATRAGAMTETIEDGRTGILVDRNDPRALADALLGLLQDRSKSSAMGQAARCKVLSERTWDITVTKLLKVFNSLMSGNAEP
jgi:glycosyltransferase involved in cell wall biosynthesis